MEGLSSQRLSHATWFSNLCASARRYKSLAPPSTAVRSTSGDSLVRRLGLIDLILLSVGASIGVGFFVVTGTIARDAGPGVTISFLLAGASCVLNALCYAELASRFPAVVGGAYMYSYSAFNEITAFLVFVQLMLDYHIGAASVSRSLASYAVALLELFPALNGSIPLWLGSGKELLGGFFSLNVLAPILLALLTLVLCQGVRESSTVNSVMTATKVVIVLIVICAGAFDIDVANWSPFAPNGFKSVLTGATVVFFSYVEFDAVANSAEESKNPQRDLPIRIMGSLLVCISLYIGVCLVLTRMVPFSLLSEDAPLAEAFSSKGMKFVSILISIGAVAGLTTTLLVGLYVQVISGTWKGWSIAFNLFQNTSNSSYTSSFSNMLKKVLMNIKVELGHFDYARSSKITGISILPIEQLSFTLEDNKETTFIDYFAEKYNYTVEYSKLLAIETGSKPAYLPMELCRIAKGQRYTKSFDQSQVVEMLKANCRRPQDREKAIKGMVEEINKSKLMSEFGVLVTDQLAVVEACVLPPSLRYKGSDLVTPQLGKWSMHNKRLVNGAIVNHWTCLNLSTRNDKDSLNFCDQLIRTCINKGMQFNRHFVILLISCSPEPERIEEALRNMHKNATGLQLLIVILSNVTGPSYGIWTMLR